MRTDFLKRSIKIEEFLELFLSLTESGISIIQALKSLAEGSETKLMAEFVLEKLKQSQSLSKALCSLSKKLKGYEELILTAEKTGNIIPPLRTVVEELKEKNESKKELIASSLYPSVIICVAAGLSLVLIKYALPFIKQVAIVEEKQMMRGIIEADLWLVLSIPLILLTAGFYSGKYNFEICLFQTLWIFEVGGIPVIKAITMLMKKGRRIKNDTKVLAQICEGLRSGKSLYVSCSKTQRFNTFTRAWLLTAEESGQAGNCFYKIYIHYKKLKDENRKRIKRFSEPFMTGVCGIYILILVIKCIVPVFETLGEGLF